MRERAIDVFRPSAIVTFAVPEATVDELFSALMGSNAEPARWFIVGSDMNLLAALNLYWQQHADVTVIHSDSSGAAARDGALKVLEHEHVSLIRCLWLHCSKSLPPAVKIGLFIDLYETEPRLIVQQVTNELNV